MSIDTICNITVSSSLLLFLFFTLIIYQLVWIVIKTPIGKLFTDLPGGRKVHQRVTPRIGGFCILLIFIPVIGFWNQIPVPFLCELPESLRLSLFWASTGIVLIGFLDDSTFFKIENKAKLLFELIVACIIVFVQGVSFPYLEIFGLTISDPLVMKIITLVWIAGVTNAMNIIDGIDGLAGTVILICLIAVATMGALTGNLYLVSVAMVLGGLVMGFLMHNYSPARIFFGDTGSLFFGIVMATFTIHLYSLEGISRNFFGPIYLVGFPLMDISVAMIRRYIKAVAGGTPWYKAFGATMVADNEHIHHRLIQRGLSHTLAVVTLGFLALSFGVSAILTALFPGSTGWIVVIYSVVMISIILLELDYFHRLERKMRSLREDDDREINDRKKICVINAGDIMSFSLQKYKQNAIEFVFFSNPQLSDIIGNYSAVLINCTGSQNLDEDVKFGVSIFDKLGFPVIVAIPDTIFFDTLNTRLMTNKINYTQKPLYIPLLLEELMGVIKNRFEVRKGEETLKGTTKIKAIRGELI